jgi:hypothetical protein
MRFDINEMFQNIWKAVPAGIGIGAGMKIFNWVYAVIDKLI